MSDASDKPETTPMSRVRKVILNAREQRALAWLLSATDNGQIISGSLLPNVMILSGIRKRLGQSASKHLLEHIKVLQDVG